jgi:hypothetical protein
MSYDAPPPATSDKPSPKPPDRYIFSGYAIGAAAHCHTLYGKNLDSVIQVPALGASVLPSIGGLSRSEVSNFCFEATYDTTRRNLISVRHIKSKAEGTTIGKEYRTLIEADIESITFIDKLHIDSVKLYVLSKRKGTDADPWITEPEVITKNRITGVHLGDVTVQVELDNDFLGSVATENLIEENGALASSKRVEEYAGTYRFNLVKNLVLTETKEIKKIAPNAVSWAGFGKIYFGEVIVKNDDRQVTLVRVEMGSDVGGSGTVGDGHSNGSAGSS